jgi:hypothetical protein
MQTVLNRKKLQSDSLQMEVHVHANSTQQKEIAKWQFANGSARFF